MTLFLIEYTAYGIRVINYDYHYNYLFYGYTKRQIEKLVRKQCGLKYKRGVVFQWWQESS